MLLLVAFLVAASCLAACHAGNNTITEEAYFDVVIQSQSGDAIKGRFVVGLFGDVAPMSALNFLMLTKGNDKVHPPPSKLQYKNMVVHRVVPDFVIQLGDVDRSGGRSVFGHRFDDEAYIHSHKSAGYVAWSNHGYDTNGSQFFITLAKARWLDNKHVVFAKVVKGMDIIKKIGDVPSEPVTSIPKQKIVISDCGIVGIAKPYNLSPEALTSDYDVLDSQKLALEKPLKRVWTVKKDL